MTTKEIYTLTQPGSSTAVEKVFNTFDEAKSFLSDKIHNYTGTRHRWGVVTLLRNGTYLAHWRPSEPCFGGLRKYKSEDSLRPTGEFKATRDEGKPSDIPSVFPLGKPVYLITGYSNNKNEPEKICKIIELLTSPTGVRKNLFEKGRPTPIINKDGLVIGLEWENLSIPSTLLVEFLMVLRYVSTSNINTLLEYTNDEYLLSIIAGSYASHWYEKEPYCLFLPFYGTPSRELLVRGEPYLDSKEGLFNEGADYQRKYNEYIWTGGFNVTQHCSNFVGIGNILGKDYVTCLKNLEKLLNGKE